MGVARYGCCDKTLMQTRSEHEREHHHRDDDLHRSDGRLPSLVRARPIERALGPRRRDLAVEAGRLRYDRAAVGYGGTRGGGDCPGNFPQRKLAEGSIRIDAEADALTSGRHD